MFFFFNDTGTTEIYTLSLHDALPIFRRQAVGPAQHRLDAGQQPARVERLRDVVVGPHLQAHDPVGLRSEEHTSELQSRQYLVCRLLLEKKKLSSPRSLPTGISCTPTP